LFSGENDDSKEVALPDFHCLVNYPDFLTKARNETNFTGAKKNCVMCGKLRVCSANSYANKGRHGNAAMLKTHLGGSEDTFHIIPRQNKGLCTACDVTVWVLVSEDVEIKWCKGCKNFRPWTAFGDKGSATKCVRCRDRQREKYALQRDEMRSRLHHGGSEGLSNFITNVRPQAPANQGLHSLLNAASTV
jgi:Zn-finger nucleic acid-binding protein